MRSSFSFPHLFFNSSGRDGKYVVMRRCFLICQNQGGGACAPLHPFCHPWLELYLSNLCFFICRSSLTTICSEIMPLVIHPSHPTSIVCIESFELSSWDKLPKLLFVVTFSMLLLSNLLLIFCFVMNGTSDWQFFYELLRHSPKLCDVWDTTKYIHCLDF